MAVMEAYFLFGSVCASLRELLVFNLSMLQKKGFHQLKLAQKRLNSTQVPPVPVI